MSGKPRSTTTAVLFKAAGDLIEGYFGMCTSYKEKIVVLYVLELSIQAFWLAISIVTFWYCVALPSSKRAFNELMQYLH